jgi:hypothetical protein
MLPGTSPEGAGPLATTPGAFDYLEMEASFESRGGVASCEELLETLRESTSQPISLLARWIVNREVLSVEWSSLRRLPLFQFDSSTMTPRPEVRAVIGELAPVLDDWLLTLWFVRPNRLLGGMLPVDAIDSHASAVLVAARSDRFLLCG